MLNTKSKRPDVTLCPLCNELLTDPRTLPCLHTFCLQCLQTRDLSSTESVTACPVCGNKYSVQPANLPPNTFIPKLIKINRIVNSAASQQTPCDVCPQDQQLSEEAATPAATATHYCLNCAENLCDRCHTLHSRMRSSRQHRVVQLGDELAAQELRGPVAQCDQHSDEPLKMFCCDCSRCICFLCYAEYHTGHHCQVDIFSGVVRRLLRGGGNGRVAHGFRNSR